MLEIRKTTPEIEEAHVLKIVSVLPVNCSHKNRIITANPVKVIKLKAFL